MQSNSFDYYMFRLCFANGVLFYFNNNVFRSMLLLEIKLLELLHKEDCINRVYPRMHA